jgi:RNA polymerase sigma-70 factor (ECF subfamily)
MRDKLSDEFLMERLVGGDKKVAGILYDRYHKMIYGYFLRMIKDPEASRDLTQNVFLKVLKYNHSWQKDKVFKYWLFRIARNICIDYYNCSKVFMGDESEIDFCREHVDLGHEMDMKESLNIVLDSMGTLSPADRELIELNRFQGLSYKEIAKTVSSTESAVRVKTYRAIQKLKEVYTQKTTE